MLLVFICPFKILNTLSFYCSLQLSSGFLRARPLKQLSKMTGTTTQQVAEYRHSAAKGYMLGSPPHWPCTGQAPMGCGYLQMVILAHFAAEELSVQEAASRASEHHMLWCRGRVCSRCPLVKPGIKLTFMVWLEARAGTDVRKHHGTGKGRRSSTCHLLVLVTGFGRRRRTEDAHQQYKHSSLFLFFSAFQSFLVAAQAFIQLFLGLLERQLGQETEHIRKPLK